MASLFRPCVERGLLTAPTFMARGVQYEVVLGSVAYGVSDDQSDLDIYGFCVPPRDEVFPHLRGEIVGFDSPRKRFEQLQEHHVHDPQAGAGSGRTYDFTIYNIVKFFRMCTDNNPNIIDSLFVPRRCVLHTTAVGELVREKRHLFLHRGAWARFKGYAYRQFHKIRTKKPEGKRTEMVDRYGYDVKFGYHIVRLLGEVEQILTEHDLDLERNREQLKAIRRGEWSLERLEGWFADKERQLEDAAARSRLPDVPDEEAIKTLLLQCLEMHYGSLDPSVVRPDELADALRSIRQVLDRVERRL
ncbi:MAG: nucleotidyltransferase domain-containing protein [Acidobacteriota bacterium]